MQLRIQQMCCPSVISCYACYQLLASLCDDIKFQLLLLLQLDIHNRTTQLSSEKCVIRVDKSRFYGRISYGAC